MYNGALQQVYTKLIYDDNIALLYNILLLLRRNNIISTDVCAKPSPTVMNSFERELNGLKYIYTYLAFSGVPVTAIVKSPSDAIIAGGH